MKKALLFALLPFILLSEIVWQNENGSVEVSARTIRFDEPLELTINANHLKEMPSLWQQNSFTAFTPIAHKIQGNAIRFILMPRYAGNVSIHIPGFPLIPITIQPTPGKEVHLLPEPLVRTDSLNPLEISRENALHFEKPATAEEINHIFKKRTFPLMPLLLAISFICTLATTIFLLRKHPVTIIESKKGQLLKSLQDIEKSFQDSYLDPEKYQNLSLTMRHYIKERFQINAPFLTTEEFLKEASEHKNVDLSSRETLKAFLKESDRVKFKGKPPTLQDLDLSLKLVHKLLKNS